MSLANCRVVLVRPRIAANIGATARAMRNFGLVDLVLVRPEADPDSADARKLSTHGEQILDRARIVGDLGEAVADCHLVVGTAARVGGPVRRQSVGPPDEIAPYVAEAARDGRAALVFGPEPTGLSNEEVTRCHHLIHIPTADDYPALNLAQAVVVCLYELRKAGLRGDSAPRTAEDRAPFASQERMFSHLRTALEEVHFLYGPNADALMHGLRHLIGRARPSAMEVDLLFGLARQLRWFAAHRGPNASPVEGVPEAPTCRAPGEVIQRESVEDLPTRLPQDGTT
jgi:tRNA/rRNA methyltransferase